MIEKLNGVERDRGAYIATELTASNSELFCKINEIIDELNHILEERESGIKVYEEVMPNMKPADKFAEQRKWIGKLCRFWDYDDRYYTYDVLTDIGDGLEYPYKTDRAAFKYCKPVSEDLIYKGE